MNFYYETLLKGCAFVAS